MAKAPKKEEKKAASSAKKSAPPATEDTGYMTVGMEGFAKKRQNDKIAALKRERQAQRFYVKAGEEAVVVFVDTMPHWVHEHSLQVNGKYGNMFTCTKGDRIDKTCHICLQKNDNPIHTAYLTIIDTRKFTRKDGTESPFRKQLIPIKGSSIGKLEDLIKKYGSLTGLAFKIKRYDKREPNCGSSFEKLGKIDIVKKYGADNAKPFDYATILKAPSADELAEIGVFPNVLGAEQAPAEGESVDEINLDDFIK